MKRTAVVMDEPMLEQGLPEPGNLRRRIDDALDRVTGLVRDRIDHDGAATVDWFVRHFYANVPPDDLVNTPDEQLYGAALAMWQAARRRQPGAATVRVYTPRVEQAGWHAQRTIVEIVNDDMPFLVDSVTAELHRQGLTVHLVIHPVLPILRDAAGEVTGLYEPGTDAPVGARPESLMHVQLNPVGDPAAQERIRAGLEGVLADVRAAVEDWRTIGSRVAESAALTTAAHAALPDGEAEEAAAFLAWMDEDNFTYLGARDYRVADGDEPGLELIAGSGLGVLRDDEVSVFDGLRHSASLSPEVRAFLRQPRPLLVTKANRDSTVHRSVALDVVLIKRFDAAGRIVGERLLVGLFTASAYNASPRDIPILRRKVADVAARAGFDPQGHDGKALLNILETYPRDELFQIQPGELFDTALGILHLQERQRLALFVRKDSFERFVSALVFVPRDRFDTDLRRKIQAILEESYNGRCAAFYTQLGDSSLARLHLIVQAGVGGIPAVDLGALEQRLVQTSRGWSDHLRAALIDANGEERGLALAARYADAFPVGYRDSHSAAQAVFDIGRIEQALAGSGFSINLGRPLEAEEDELHVTIHHVGRPIALSDTLPMLEHMDLRVITEEPFAVTPLGAKQPVWVQDFAVRSATRWPTDAADAKRHFQEAFAAVWDGRMEDDGFNRLILRAGLTAREVVVLRAYAKFLKQARFAYAQDTVEATLAAHPDTARLIAQLFAARFDPKNRADEAPILEAIDAALDAVTNLDDDRILRRFVTLVRATLRTNAYQTLPNGQPKPYLSLKFNSGQIDELPLPRPWVEVFVYSPRMEGVHLRGGKVARGGIRWSDRREDFRTEILGLMKAQMVKNTVIVPVGSKGGFVVKRPPPASSGREAFQAEGVECYKLLMRGLLDLTDNLTADGSVMPPADVVRHDGDDPYLVVAADKGTATFSDIANGVSIDHGFWLGDAFASGGSVGYDHKVMGITARGAWESVKRHFRETGLDIQTTDFSVVGVGDMSGDVFGNGMLLSKHIRLLAAFDHRHIFLDPDPNPATSWAERARLFALPRSSWAEYDRALLSKGGMIVERALKSVELTPEVRACFGIEATHIAPAELMRRLLTAKVDLLWFGGIGTYIKESGETNAEAGDKATDALRVDGRDIRASVIGEGANLGATQRGRIEAARFGANGQGVRLNTDAIDNSAGVDTSDHEVNIKVLLGDVVARGDMTTKQRDVLMAAMTDEVAGLVLADNYRQSQALTIAQAQGPALLEAQARFIRTLEKAGRLNRAIEYLPSDEDLAERMAERRGLTRPELAVLLAYAKITLYDDLLASDLPDDPAMAGDLLAYFPKPLQESQGEAIARHRLRREIVATQVTNSLVNRVGPTFVREMMEKTGLGPADVARAYAITREVFGLRDLWTAIDALDNRVPAAAQDALTLDILALVERSVGWFLVNGDHPLSITAGVASFRPSVDALIADLDRVLDAEEQARLSARAARHSAQGVPDALAQRIAALPVLAAAPDLARVAARTGQPVTAVAAVYVGLGRRFALDWLRDKAQATRAENHWQKQAVAAIMDDLFAHQMELTVRVLESAAMTDGQDGAEGWIARWTAGRRAAVERIEPLIAELRGQSAVDLPMLTVASRQLRGLTSGA